MMGWHNFNRETPRILSGLTKQFVTGLLIMLLTTPTTTSNKTSTGVNDNK